jgi:hypothetical protein
LIHYCILLGSFWIVLWCTDPRTSSRLITYVSFCLCRFIFLRFIVPVICVSVLCCPLWATWLLPHRVHKQELNGNESDYYSYHLNLRYIYPRKVPRTPSNRQHSSFHLICEVHVICIVLCVICVVLCIVCV